MTHVEFLISYLAIGSAFAMRAYFQCRHRSILSVFRAVAVELVFWLPKWAAISIRRLLHQPASTMRPRRPKTPGDPEIDAYISDLVESLVSSPGGKRVRDAAEIYVALQSAVALGEKDSEPSGQFELFEIAGHLNGRPGSACLFRRNLGKIRRHSQRAANDLISLVLVDGQARPSETTVSFLIALFRACSDERSIVSLVRTYERALGRTYHQSEKMTVEIV